MGVDEGSLFVVLSLLVIGIASHIFDWLQKSFFNYLIDQNIIKRDACEAPRSPCGKYEQNSFADAIIWADVGNDL